MKVKLTLQQQVEIAHLGKLLSTGKLPFYRYHMLMYKYYSE